MSPPSIRTTFDIASSLEQLQTLVGSIDNTKLPSVQHQNPTTAKPASSSATSSSSAEQPTTSSSDKPTTSTDSKCTTSAAASTDTQPTASTKPTKTGPPSRGKRVRVQAFQQILEVSPAMKLQRTVAAATITGRSMSATDLEGTSTHNPTVSDGSRDSNRKQSRLSNQSGCNPLESGKPCLPPSLPQPTVVLEASHRLIMDVLKEDMSALESKQEGKQEGKQDAVCKWVYKISVSNPKLVEILCSRDVLCFSKEMLSEDLPSCTELQSITRFDWTDLEVLPWE